MNSWLGVMFNMIRYQDFSGKKDMIFCGVFDGHGPLGHKFSNSIRDKLPLKLSASIKQSQQKAINDNDTNETDVISHSNVYAEDNQNMSFSSWEGSFMRCFSEMDEDLAKNIDTKGFRGGSTAVTVIKQVESSLFTIALPPSQFCFLKNVIIDHILSPLNFRVTN